MNGKALQFSVVWFAARLFWFVAFFFFSTSKRAGFFLAALSISFYPYLYVFLLSLSVPLCNLMRVFLCHRRCGLLRPPVVGCTQFKTQPSTLTNSRWPTVLLHPNCFGLSFSISRMWMFFPLFLFYPFISILLLGTHSLSCGTLTKAKKADE